MTAARDANRAKFPTVARFVDDMRKVFGPGVKPLYVREGENEAGDRALFEEIEREFGRKPS
jgi:hypothetical protein